MGDARVLDGVLRRWYAPFLQAPARGLHRMGVGPGAVTLLAFLAGVAAAAALLAGHPLVALGLWLANRVLDGLDGVVARASGRSSDLGGYLDFLADVVVYASIVASLAAVHPSTRAPFLVLLAVIPVNLTAHLSLATLIEKRAAAGRRDERNLLLVPGIAEGFETIVAFSLMIAWPALAPWVAGAFAALVAAAVVQRIVLATRLLGGPP